MKATMFTGARVAASASRPWTTFGGTYGTPPKMDVIPLHRIVTIGWKATGRMKAQQTKEEKKKNNNININIINKITTTNNNNNTTTNISSKTNHNNNNNIRKKLGFLSQVVSKT
mmetsp:Transcript_15425/g.33782  ORF Transcript_15425/g.33782 Transcript_15425/m.33782 type:complete len:114 (+) Transcript_15425:1871-2212(+)